MLTSKKIYLSYITQMSVRTSQKHYSVFATNTNLLMAQGKSSFIVTIIRNKCNLNANSMTFNGYRFVNGSDSS